ncbi:alanine dehydrogenase [Candidatus Micrarchaeota archaeon]|nr:alanine dehydrogenase [Candidatus Micrarchaeota archaeon]MBU1930084.1 alanine dehydrogenase [Candidatus Micrarchaeota archaeon]
MIVGTIKEIKNNENRVGLTPQGAYRLVQEGHTVLVEKDAGIGSGFSNEDFEKAGAQIESYARTVWKEAKLIVKIKEPLSPEFDLIQPEQIIFTYFHFASSQPLLDAMLKSKATCIAYETIGEKSKHPLLAPMSEVAGKMATLMGTYFLAKFAGGKGILVSGVSGVEGAHVVILGTGVVGRSAAWIATALGAKVTLLVHKPSRIPELQELFPNAKLVESTPENIEKIVPTADLLVGAVYATGARAPTLVSEALVQKMQRGSVIVDVAIDQGGCIATSQPTTHENPVFEKHGVIHYCVANMPGAFPRTSTIALTNATFPFVKRLAEKELHALKEDNSFLNGLNVINGQITNQKVAEAFERNWVKVEELL